MGLTNAYVQGISKIPDFFKKIQDGQAPEQFSQQILKDWGFQSTNDRLFIPLLKALGFLSPDGKPTSRYLSYRDHSQSKYVMAEAIKEVYQDIFLISAKPTQNDKDAVLGKFKSYHNATDRMATLMTGTFFALLALADLKEQKRKTEVTSDDTDKLRKDKDLSEEGKMKGPHPTPPKPSLHYNIQIHLPATKDVEVYNAIFRSLKDHLYEA